MIAGIDSCVGEVNNTSDKVNKMEELETKNLSVTNTMMVLTSKKEKEETKQDRKTKKLSESEFVSDTLQASEADLEEVKAGMKKLGIDSLARQALVTRSGKR